MKADVEFSNVSYRGWKHLSLFFVFSSSCIYGRQSKFSLLFLFFICSYLHSGRSNLAFCRSWRTALIALNHSSYASAPKNNVLYLGVQGAALCLLALSGPAGSGRQTSFRPLQPVPDGPRYKLPLHRQACPALSKRIAAVATLVSCVKGAKEE